VIPSAAVAALRVHELRNDPVCIITKFLACDGTFARSFFLARLVVNFLDNRGLTIYYYKDSSYKSIMNEKRAECNFCLKIRTK